MEKRIYTAGEIKIEVDKYEDKKAKEHRRWLMLLR